MAGAALISRLLSSRRKRVHSDFKQRSSGRTFVRPSLQLLEDRTLLDATIVQLGPIAFRSESGFSQIGSSYSFQGLDIQVGYAPEASTAFAPLISVAGVISFDTAAATPTFQIKNGLLANEVGPNYTVWSGSQMLNADDLVGAGVPLAAGTRTFAIQGLTFTPDALRFANPSNPQLQLQGVYAPSSAPDFRISVHGSSFVAMDATGPTLSSIPASQSGISQSESLFGLGIIVAAYTAAPQANGTIDVTASVNVPLLGTNANLQLNMVVETATGDVNSLTLELASGSCFLGLLQVVVEPVNPLLITYSSADNDYVVTGEIEIQSFFNAGTILGGTLPDGTVQNGITIENGSFDLDNVTIFLAYTVAGSFGLENFSLTYSNTPLDPRNTNFTGIYLSGKGTIQLPGQWSVGAEAGFDIGSLNGQTVFIPTSIGLEVQFGRGIPIPGTGIRVLQLGGEIQNIPDPTQWIVSAKMALSYGPTVTFAGKTDVYPLEAQVEGQISADGLYVEGDIYCFAISDAKSATGFSGLVGSGTGKINLQWAEGIYQAELQMQLYDDTFNFEAIVGLDSSNNMVFGGVASLNVPEGVPIIGGDRLASADFVFEYHPPSDTSDGIPVNSFVAGWIGILNQDYGIQYTLSSSSADADSSGSWTFIGTSTVDAIITGSTKSGNDFTYPANPQTFTIPEGATSALIYAVWSDQGGTQTLNVSTGNGTLPTGTISTSGAIVGTGQIIPNEGRPITNFTPPQGQRALAYAIMGSSFDPEDPIFGSVINVSLTSSVALPVSGDSNPNPVSFQVFYSYGIAQIDAPVLDDTGTSALKYTLNGSVNEDYASTTSVTFYVDKRPDGYQGIPVQILSTSDGTLSVDAAGTFSQSLFWNGQILLPYGTYYFYAVLNDGHNTPVRSAYSIAESLYPPLTGRIVNPQNNNQPQPGVRVYLDVAGNGIYDHEQDPLAVTDFQGYYLFWNPTLSTTTFFERGSSYTVALDLSGTNLVFQSSDGGASTDSVTFTFPTSDQEIVNFGVASLAAIRGTAFNDWNMNGIQENGEAGIGNIQITLSWVSNNQTITSTTITGPAGRFAFNNLQANTTYTLTYQTTSKSPPFVTSSATLQSLKVNVGSLADDAQFSQFSDNDFALVLLQSISGSILGLPTGGTASGQPATGLAGVQLTLLDQNHNSTGMTALSDSDGNYTFTGVLPGTYYIQENAPTNYEPVSPIQGQLSYSTTNYVALPAGSAYPVNSLAVGDANGDGKLDIGVVPNVAGGMSIWYGYLTTGDDRNYTNVTSSHTLSTIAFGAVSQLESGVNAGTNQLDALVGTDDGVYLMIPDQSGTSSYIPGSPNVASPPTQQYTGQPVQFSYPGGVSGTVSNIVTGNFYVSDNSTVSNQSFAYTVDGSDNPQVVVVFVSSVSSSGKVSSKTENYTYFGGGGLASGYVTSQPGNGTQLLFFQQFDSSDPVKLTLATPKDSNGFNMTQSGYGFAPGTQAGQIALGDINGDGTLDIVFSTSTVANGATTTTIWYWLNLPAQGGIQWNEAPVEIYSFAGTLVKGLVLTDLNGNGQTDLAFMPQPSSGQNAQVIVFLNQVQGASYFNLPEPAVSGEPFSAIQQAIFTSTPQVTISLPQSLVLAPTALAAGLSSASGVPSLFVGDSHYMGVFVFPGQVATTAAYAVTVQGSSPANRDFVNEPLAQVSGSVYQASSNSAGSSAANAAVAGTRVFVDTNFDGIYEPGEPTAFTDQFGRYAFAGLPAGTYSLMAELPAGYVTTSELGAQYWISVRPGTTQAGLDFPLIPQFLGRVASQTIKAGNLLSLDIRGPLPTARHLSYTMTGAPEGATLNQSTGEFSWRAPAFQSEATYWVTLFATDTDAPHQRQSFTFDLSYQNVPSPEGFVAALYQQLLNRPALDAGASFWVSQLQSGVSRLSVVEGIWASEEHRAIEVVAFYERYLHRLPDAAGGVAWVNAMLAGLGEIGVIVGLVTSPEYTQSHPNIPSYIYGLYQDVLSRAPDSAGQAYWQQQANSGADRAAIASRILQSPEAATDIINASYSSFLGREGTVDEVAGWLAAQEGVPLTSAQVEQLFLASDEYYSLT